MGSSLACAGMPEQLWLNNTEHQGRHFDLNPAAVHLRLVIAPLYKDQNLHGCNSSGTRLLSACSAQQH